MHYLQPYGLTYGIEDNTILLNEMSFIQYSTVLLRLSIHTPCPSQSCTARLQIQSPHSLLRPHPPHILHSCIHSTALSIRGAATLIAFMPAIMHRHLEPPSSWRAFFCGGGTDSSCSSEAAPAPSAAAAEAAAAGALWIFPALFTALGRCTLWSHRRTAALHSSRKGRTRASFFFYLLTTLTNIVC